MAQRGRRGGRRVKRGQRAAEAQRAPHVDDCAVVEAALAQDAWQRIVDWVARTNPRRTGAHVADILDELCQTDSYLHLVEPYWDRHGDALSAELGEWHGVVSPSACAAVLLLGLTTVGQPPLAYERMADRDRALVVLSDVDRELPSGFADLIERLARAAAAGESATVSAPDVRELAGWVDAEGRLAVRHPVEEELMFALTGECDSCVHPRTDHDPETGACERVNPFFGPCPCVHTPAEVGAAQRDLFARYSGARG